MEHPSAGGAGTDLREIFRAWVHSACRRFAVKGGALLVLIDEDGIVAASEFAIPDAGNAAAAPGVRPGMSWSEAAAICGADDAIARSLVSRRFEASRRSAAAPVEAGERRFWLGMVLPQRLPGSDVAGMFSEVLASFGDEIGFAAAVRVQGRLPLKLEMVRAFVGKTNAADVLKEALQWMNREFAGERCHLLLTQDVGGVEGPVKPLVIRRPYIDLCSRAYVEGRTLTVRAGEPAESWTIREIAAPLKGRQGIYGIIHIVAANRLDEEDASFTALLAETAGMAFEFARLYEQSAARVKDLRIINEITIRLNRNLQIGEVLQFASNELLSIFSADYCCLLQVDNAKRHLVVRASNAELLVNETVDLSYGFAGMIFRSREPVIIPDYAAGKHVESKLMHLTKARSLIGSPLIASGETVGAILLVHREPNFFTYEHSQLLQVLSDHIGPALINASLHAEMRRMVITDQLSGLFVRHYLYEQIRQFQKKDPCGSLIVVDIDNFKQINDTFGHLMGDKVLIQVAKIISSCIRETDIAARWGGEELAVYLPRMDSDSTCNVAERICRSVSNETFPKVTISCGVADWRRDERSISVDTLFHRADLALYHAKNSGKNQIRIYHPDEENGYNT